MTLRDYSHTSPCDNLTSLREIMRDGPAQQATTIIDCTGDLASDDALPPSLRAAAAQTLLDDLARALARVIIDMHAKGQTADQEPPP